MNDRVLEAVANGPRLLAYLFDNFAWILTVLLLPPGVGFVVLLAWIGWWVVLSTQGMSPGKKVMGLVCVDVHSGRPASFRKMLARDFLAKGLLGAVTFGITGLVGTIQILASSDRRALWDKMTDTLVVERAAVRSGDEEDADDVPVPAPHPDPPVPSAAIVDPGSLVSPSPPVASNGSVAGSVPAAPTVDIDGLDDRTISRGALAGSASAPTQWCIKSSWGLNRVVAEGTVIVVGRDPEQAPVASHVEMERTPPGARAVSKTHCVLRVGRIVSVEDRASRNGTIIEPPGGRAVALRPNDPVPVVAGTRILLGDQWLLVEADA